MTDRSRRVRSLMTAAIVAWLAAAPPVSAEPQETVGAALRAHEDQPAPQPGARRDFLFGRPHGWIGLRGSWLMPRESGDLFAFVNDQLTIDKGDFKTGAIAGEGGFAITSRISAAIGVEYSQQTLASEYRRFIDNQGQPINQSTLLRQTNVSGSVKITLLEPGRSISQLAFVPRTVVPYIGGGGGFYHYELRQAGDFVDFATLRVFPDAFISKGSAPSMHVFGGTDVRLWRLLFFSVEGRYVWAHPGLGADFVGFDGIDLDSFRMSTGFHVVF